MIVVVCPGQGSQTPGFLEPWLAVPGARTQLDRYSEAAGLDLVAHGTVSDADTIRDTAVAQPLIVAAGLITLTALLADGRRKKVDGIAGQTVVPNSLSNCSLSRLMRSLARPSIQTKPSKADPFQWNSVPPL